MNKDIQRILAELHDRLVNPGLMSEDEVCRPSSATLALAIAFVKDLERHLKEKHNVTRGSVEFYYDESTTMRGEICLIVKNEPRKITYTINVDEGAFAIKEDVFETTTKLIRVVAVPHERYATERALFKWRTDFEAARARCEKANEVFAELKKNCPHDWVYIPDASGNNDSGYRCSYCGEERHRIK